MKEFDRIYAPVYLDRIEENMKAMGRMLKPGTMVIGVVKADGYGHGALPAAKVISPYVSGYGVATADEALELRRGGIKKGILVLGAVSPVRFRELAAEEIRPAVFRLREAELLSETAVSMGKKAKVHLAVDTGMNRIGMAPNEASAETAGKIAALPGIEIEGMFTHFSRADEADRAPALGQLEAFLRFRELLRKRGIKVPVCHASNSAGILRLREADLDAVRAGVAMYGLPPSGVPDRENAFLKPAMELRSFVTYIKEIPAGAEVSYGGTFRAEKPTRVATVSAGYGDGYPRSLSGKGEVLICGKRARILGRICMDQLMADVTEIPEAEEGASVTLLGRDGDQVISMEELAERSGGFHYELPCILGKRVPRVYMYHGKRIGYREWFSGAYHGDSEFF